MIFLSILLTAAADTFIQVGTFVAITLLLFGYINYKSHGSLIKNFTTHKNLQVLVGTFLGLTPGCGGAILVMPLYLKGQVSFGTVLATLIATMGDAAFVLIVSVPQSYLIISLLSALTAIITGYGYDFIVKNPFYTPAFTDAYLQEQSTLFQPEQEEYSTTFMSSKTQHIMYFFRHNIGYIIIWTFALLTLPLGIMNILQIDYNTIFPVKNLGIIGAIGTLFCVLYSFISNKIFSDDTLPEIKSKQSSFKETLIHNAEETSFVVMWVFFALFAYEIVIYLLGGEEIFTQIIPQNSYMVVIIAMLIGLIPGCGPHIILATLFSQGLIPFSAMIANAICNDGDALFPLLAMNKKSAVIASLYSLIPAFIVGTIVYFLGF